MSFINIFKSISSFQFPYTLETKPIFETSLWQVFDGSRKADSLPVTVFKANVTSQNEQLIANSIHKAKILKIPGLCHVLDTFDSDSQSTFVVTERVKPFPWDDIKNLQRNKEGIELGISQLLTTLKFLNAFVLGTISRQSIFIDSKGQWLLFGLELCEKKTDVDSSKFGSQVQLYNRLAGLQTTTEEYHTIDSLQLSSLITDLMGGPSKIPKDWQQPIQNLSRARITLDSFIDRLESTSTWLSNPLIDIYKQLKELHIKDPQGKLLVMTQIQNAFFESRNLFHSLSPGFIEGLLTPELTNAIQWLITSQNNSASSISKLIPLLAILLDLSMDKASLPEASKNVIYECFALPDRQVRFLLLIYLSKISQKLSSNEISAKIYPRFAQGLADSDPTLRLQTLKNIPIVVSHISERQLNNELLRYLAKTQVDQDVEIRTWTVIIITKISTLLSTSSGNRSNILATAFTKSLKDPSIKPRLAALYGLNKSIELFDVTTIANKILTVIAPGLLDKDPLVRSKAKNLFEKYLNKLEDEAKSLQETSFNGKQSEDVNFDAYGEQDESNDDELVKQFMATVMIASSPEPDLAPISGSSDVDNEWNAFNDASDELKVQNSSAGQEGTQGSSISSKNAPSSKNVPSPIAVQKSWYDDFNDDDDGWDEADIWDQEVVPVSKVTKAASKTTKKPSILDGTKTKSSILTPRSSTAKPAGPSRGIINAKSSQKVTKKIQTQIIDTEEDDWDTAW